MSSEWPTLLGHADFCRVRFALDFLRPCRLGPGELLRLRRPLRAAAQQVFAGHSAPGGSRLARLFEPSPSPDCFARKKYQKPAPGFVIRPAAGLERWVDAGDRLELDVVFIGTGIDLLGDFLLCLDTLGHQGLVRGEGHFEVTDVLSVGLHGQTQTVWRQNEHWAQLTPEINTLASYLELTLPLGGALRLDIDTPARLVHAGRLLRAPGFPQLFPFMLRRVSSMLHAHCGLEICDDPASLLVAARGVTPLAAAWIWQDWQDWQDLGNNPQRDNLGGLTGHLVVEGSELAQLAWVAGLCTLLGIGRGAAYGAGQLRLAGP